VSNKPVEEMAQAHICNPVDRSISVNLGYRPLVGFVARPGRLIDLALVE